MCTRCFHDLPADSFWKSRRGRYGRRSICKTCHDECYHSTPEHWAAQLARGMKASSKKRGHPLPELEAKDILPALLLGACQVSGVAFEFKKGSPRAPSVDRINTTLPYTRNNIRVVCWAINLGTYVWGLQAVLPIWAAAAGCLHTSESQ